MAAGSTQLEDRAGSVDASPHYRPQLDGLRAVAVYLVVAFHSGLARFDGGFIGVDIFFVLSGYLVTQLLLRDVLGQGRIGFARFYSRRFRRLLPASFVVLLATTAAFTAVAAPAEALEALRSIKAAFLYVANWFFIRDSNDYFGGDVTASPVLHFWSLSIEEQFYAIWPLLLGGLVFATRRAGRAQWHVIRGAVAIGAACSLVAALQLADTNFSRAYYGTDTRAYQLLAGAFLALTPPVFSFAQRHWRELRWVAPAALVTLVLLGTSIVDVGPITRGAIVAAVTCVLLVTIEGAPGGFVRWGLSRSPLVYLGRVSYGTYLWHWPIIVVALRIVDISPGALFIVAAGLATGLASLSFQMLERPVRESRPLDRYRVPVVALGLAMSIVGAFVLAPAMVDDHRSQVSVSREIAATSDAGDVNVSDLDWRAARDDWMPSRHCINRAVENCTVVDGGSPHMLLMGDSNAEMLVPTFIEIAERVGGTLSVAMRESCPWQQDLLFADFKNQDLCRAHHADWYSRVVPSLDPDVVVLINRTFDDPVSPAALDTPDGRVDPGSDELLHEVRRATERSLETFRDQGRKVVVIEPIPYAPRGYRPISCLSQASDVDECRYVASPGPMGVERVYRKAAGNDDGIWVLDMDRLVCPFLPICDPVIAGEIVKLDGGHLTATYARSISGDIEGYLKDNAIIDS